MAERLTGATREEARGWDRAAIERALGGLPPHKAHCAAIAADAVRSALAAWPAV